MDRSVDSKFWRRGFAAGFLALALSVGGQVVSSRLSADAHSCPLAAQPGIAERVIQHLKPSVRAHGGVAQRVALALLGAMLHDTCS